MPWIKHRACVSGRKTPEYVAWQDMKNRCTSPTNPRYAAYGGAGVTVDARWLDSFPAFLEDVGPRPSAQHSLDRYPDPAGNYEPTNVRWATRAEQQRNRRDATTLTVDGATRNLYEWAALNGICVETLRNRIRLGWPPAEIVGTPPMSRADGARRRMRTAKGGTQDA